MPRVVCSRQSWWYHLRRQVRKMLIFGWPGPSGSCGRGWKLHAGWELRHRSLKTTAKIYQLLIQLQRVRYISKFLLKNLDLLHSLLYTVKFYQIYVPHQNVNVYTIKMNSFNWIWYKFCTNGSKYLAQLTMTNASRLHYVQY